MDGDSNSILSAIIILALLFFAAYFGVCETAFAAVNRIKLKTAADRGDRAAKRAVYVCEHFDRAITSILIGNNIVQLSAASYITVLVTRRWGVDAVTLSTFLTTLLVFFVGEMLPKSIGKKYSERFSMGTAGSLCFFMRIFSPISFLLTAIGNAVAALTKGDSEVTVTEDELYDIIETMTDEGELDDAQGELVNNALSFGDVTVESILTARVDVVAAAVDMPTAQLLELVKNLRHSRIPVYEGSIDNIIGVLQIRKFIRACLDHDNNVDLRSLLDEPYFIHQSTNIDELLPIMSSKKLNMAIVSDNYGGTLGIVTVEDILEELVGDIWDEEDIVVQSAVENPDGTYSFAADMDIEDCFEFMDYEDPDKFDFEHKLLGEWTYEQFDRMPEEGDSFEYNGLRFTVQEIEHRRILKLRAEKLPEETAAGGEEA